MSETKPNTIPPAPGRWRAVTLAAVVHVALLAFLWIGVRWQNETPVAVEAEVWSPQAREAAPRPQPPPEVKPEIKPDPKPEPQPGPKPVVEEPKPAIDPDIALEKEKKRKLKEKLAREEEDRIEKAEKKKLDAKIEAAARKKLAEEDARKAAAEAKKEAAEKLRLQEAAEEKRIAKVRDEEMKRITGSVTGSGGSGDSAKSQGSRVDASYGQKIAARVKANTTFIVPSNIVGESAVEFSVEVLPDGSLRNVRKLKSSGVAGFDEAVERAIAKSAPFPADKSGAYPSPITISHKPKDQ